VGKSRRWDGEQETASDARFFDARESGYRGPIDRHGNRDTASDDAAALRRMASDRGEEVPW